MANNKKDKKIESDSPSSGDETNVIDKILDSKRNKDRHLGSRAAGQIEWSEKISTGSFIFDMVLDGGFRCGWSRFMSKSPEAGKTSMGMRWGAEWQKRFPDNGVVIYFNAEGRITKDIVEYSTVDTSRDKFRIIDTNSGDFVFDFIEEIVAQNTGNRYFFMIDSTDALNRDGDSDKSYSDSAKIAGGAVLASNAGRRLSLPISVKGHHLFICSQERAKMTQGPGGGGTDASGGNAPKFYSSLTGEIQPMYSSQQFNSYINEVMDDISTPAIGHIQKILLTKTPNQKTRTVVSIPIKYGHKGGIWSAYEAMMLAQMWDMVDSAGAWNSLSEDYIEYLTGVGALNLKTDPVKFQGKQRLRDFYDSRPDVVSATLSKIKEISST
jgi:hypothetical protein